MPKEIRFSVSKPGSMFRRFAKVRNNNPALTVSARVRAISVTTKALRSLPRVLVTRFLFVPSLSELLRFERSKYTEGARPKAIPVTIVVIKQNVRTFQSNPISLGQKRARNIESPDRKQDTCTPTDNRKN